MRHELTDHEWAVIRPMLPNKPRGVPRVNDRRVLNGEGPHRRHRLKAGAQQTPVGLAARPLISGRWLARRRTHCLRRQSQAERDLPPRSRW